MIGVGVGLSGYQVIRCNCSGRGWDYRVLKVQQELSYKVRKVQLIGEEWGVIRTTRYILLVWGKVLKYNTSVNKRRRL